MTIRGRKMAAGGVVRGLVSRHSFHQFSGGVALWSPLLGRVRERKGWVGGGVTGCSEVTTTWREVWSPSEPRKAPTEGPPSANKRGSGRTRRHSQGRPPGHGRRNIKLARVVAEESTNRARVNKSECLHDKTQRS